MNNIYPIYTLDCGVKEGATVGTFTISSNGIKIPAITVGEVGRGRSLGVLPVHLPPELYAKWQEGGSVQVFAGGVGKTRTGRVKLFVEKEPTTDEKFLAVLPTKIGYRGGNSHTGDREEEYWEAALPVGEYEKAGIPIKGRYTRDEVLEYSKMFVAAHKSRYNDIYGGNYEYRWDFGFSHKIQFAKFPGEVLVQGSIAEGDAGSMGRGEQFIALIPRGVWFRTAYSGRLYGAPASHYFMWDGHVVVSLTWEERQTLDAINSKEEVEWL